MSGFGIILCLFLSHTVVHFLGQSFSVLLPSIQKTFDVTPIAIGSLITVKEVTAGFIALPGGIAADYFNRHRYLIMAISLGVFGLGWLVISFSPFYAFLFFGISIIALGSSIWHLPSIVELGSRFPDKRGTVLAVHGAGGSVGDITGPIITGVILMYLTWQKILTVYAILPILMALWTYWLYSGVKRKNLQKQELEKDKQQPAMSLGEQLRLSREILKNTQVWKINLVAVFRSMCFATLTTFLPIYMYDSGFSNSSIGFHFGILWAIGLFISPLMGYLSDRYGRKIVLVPTLLYSSLLTILLALAGSGMMFTILLVLLGFSIRSDYSLINATMIDIVKQQVETTMLGILSFFRYLMAACAPIIAGALYQYYGMHATLTFVSLLFLSAGLLFWTVNLAGD